MKAGGFARGLAYWAPFFALALLLHGGIWLLTARQAARVAALREAERAESARATAAEPNYVRVDVPSVPSTSAPEPSPPPPDAVLEPERPQPSWDGQIVEVARPLEERRPDEARYLAEYDTTVAEETRAPQFAINPEVVAPEFSDARAEESRASEAAEVGTDAPNSEASEPARPSRFDPARDGVLGRLPTLADPRDAPWLQDNREGRERASAAVTDDARLAGAPQNDRLDERTGSGTYLNTKELLYAEYLLRIRRLVNFYWEQNLANLPSSVRVAKPEYTTVVSATLTADGQLETLEITSSSGLEPLDDAVARAFRIAGPYPNPPTGLVSPDGRVYLPKMAWTVRFGTADNRAMGVDPNADVLFPGLHQGIR